MTTNENVDYSSLYNGYWESSDRIGESSTDLSTVADHVISLFGLGKVLDIGSGEGLLVGELLRNGCDAYGLDVSQTVVDRANGRVPGRFTCGSVLDLPYENEYFQSIVSTDCLEHLAPTDVPKALKEMYRVCKKNMLLQIATTQDRDGHWHLTVEGRRWWEQKCLDAGFKKHPRYYKINDYERLNQDSWQIYILLEKIPQGLLEEFSLESLEAERGLHMDMLRDVGERSDAHVIRYHWASSYIKPGDRVLDAACGLGYGGHVLRSLTAASSVTGIDGSEGSIRYANLVYESSEGRGDYRCGMLPEALSSYEDGSFEVVVSFETLEHVEDPEGLLAEMFRVLTPGGRVIVSVPNDWSDETGRDPNPYHLHVYDWSRLKSELERHFILEGAFAQTASRCKVRAKGNQWVPRGRELFPVPLGDDAPADSEWWLMSAMKSPLQQDKGSYEERVFANIRDTDHPSIQYSKYYNNPWLMHAMVNIEYRLKNKDELVRLAEQVIDAYPKRSADYSAAVCVACYLSLERGGREKKEELISLVDAIVSQEVENPMALRWKVSLLFIKSRLLQSLGKFLEAYDSYKECAKINVLPFGVHLSTKTSEAAYLAGSIAYSMGWYSQAREAWMRGIEVGKEIIGCSIESVLINVEAPNLFNHGDGAREFSIAWDNIARCANGINLLGSGREIDYSILDNSLQTEYTGVTKNVFQTRKYLASYEEELKSERQILKERTEFLERASGELISRTAELVETRETVRERTERLERVSVELAARDHELISTRAILQDCREKLDKALADINRKSKRLGADHESINPAEVVGNNDFNAQKSTETKENAEVAQVINGCKSKESGFSRMIKRFLKK